MGPDVNREQIGGAGRGPGRQSVGRSATVRSCGIFTEARGSGGQGRAQGRRRSEGRGCAGTASEAGTVPGRAVPGPERQSVPERDGPELQDIYGSTVQLKPGRGAGARDVVEV